MAIEDQEINDKYAIYLGGCIEVMQDMPSESVHLSIYSPPFGGLYQYSSDARDLSNSLDYKEFFEHYAFVINGIYDLTLPGRMSAVHCMDIPTGNSGLDNLIDFPGDIIRLHEKFGWKYVARYHVWKEPLMVRNRTMMKSLHHKSMCLDSTKCSLANADYLLIFRKKGENKIPVVHPTGLMDYAGERNPPAETLGHRGFSGNQIENIYSHWIWRQYASAFWDDIRIDRVLPYKLSKGEDDEKHVHLQLDVIERCLILWSNPGEVVFTPFMGVGSEVYAAVKNNRLGIGVELKESYYRQAKANIECAKKETREQGVLI